MIPGILALTLVSCRIVRPPPSLAFDSAAWKLDSGTQFPEDSARRKEIRDLCTNLIRRRVLMQTDVLRLLGPPIAQSKGNPWGSEVAIVPPTPAETWIYNVCKDERQDVLLLGFDKSGKLLWTTASIAF